jgi:hypothetical protein
MRYVLMQAPKQEKDYSSQIVILDNSNQIGRDRVQHYVNRGWTEVGSIESDLPPQDLRSGFEHDKRKSLEKAYELFQQISNLADAGNTL